MLAGQQPGQTVLRHVGVLKLVDEQVAVAGVVLVLHFLDIFQQLRRPHQEVVKIQGVLARQRLLVISIDAGASLYPMSAIFVLGIIGSFGHTAGVLEAAFGGGNARENGSGGVSFAIHVRQLHRGLERVQLVVLIVYGEVPIQADTFTMSAQNAGAHGVEGAHSDGFAAAEQQPIEAVSHFPGGFIGERDRQYLPGVYAAIPYQISDAVGDDAGFARTGTGDYEQRALSSNNRLLLCLVEPL